MWGWRALDDGKPVEETGGDGRLHGGARERGGAERLAGWAGGPGRRGGRAAERSEGAVRRRQGRREGGPGRAALRVGAGRGGRGCAWDDLQLLLGVAAQPHEQRRVLDGAALQPQTVDGDGGLQLNAPRLVAAFTV